MHNVGIDFYLCDSADKFGDKSNFVSCGHRVHLADFASLADVVVPVLPGFWIARKCAYERREAVKFVVERVV